MIRYKGKGFKAFKYKGRNIGSIWCKGKKIWPEGGVKPKPEPDIKGGEILFVINTPNNNFNLDLSPHLSATEEDGTTIIQIDWGDGSDIENYNLTTIINPDNTIAHEYKDKNEYYVKLKGYIKWNTKLASRYSLSQCLISVELPTEDSPIKELGEYGGFYYCPNLISIPEKLFANCINITNFDYTFIGCHQLKNIPEKLFENCKNVLSFHRTFVDCHNIIIPENLFKNCTEVTSFAHCFSGNNLLESIPENLFKYNTKVIDFSYCFSNWSSLKNIPEKLFENNINVTNFEYTFYLCRTLQSIPLNLFKNNINVTNFDRTFAYGNSITSNLPELWKTHSSAWHEWCFNDCNKAPNFQDAVNAGWA